MTDDRREWFAAKQYGLGAGLPIAWQGWLLFIGFMVIVIVGAITLAPRSPLAYLALVMPLAFGFAVIASKTTRGGWRWRWGQRD